MKNRIVLISLLWLLSLPTLRLVAQTPSYLSHLTCDTVPELFLTLDWKNLIRHKKDKEYVDATLYCKSLPGTTSPLQAKVRTRGHMRLNICEYPPLKVKLNKDILAEMNMSEFNEFDIVHPCEDIPAYTQLILREYLAYKLWELISPLHLRTQLVKLHYLDTDGTAAFEPDYAFLVEDQEEFSARIEAKRIKVTTMHKGALNKEAMLRICLFQFMIGNTDWYVSNSHNLEFFGMPDNPLLQIVPYDFDYSGLVNAPYAAHHESINLTSTTVRYYQGWCESMEEVNEQLTVFINNKQAILDLPKHIHGLDERSIRYTTEFLQQFFDIIEHPKKLENQVMKHCDMWPVKN
jgi:hypothetical protein